MTRTNETDHDTNPPATVSEVALVRAPLRVIVPIETIRSMPTAGAAFVLACDASGLDDKEIYGVLGIDQGYFSNIRNNKATLKADLEVEFCKRVGNMIYPEWRAWQHGCTLVEIETAATRRADAAERRADEAERKLDVFTSILTPRVPA